MRKDKVLAALKAPPGALWEAARYRLLQFFGQRDYVPFVILSRSRTGSNLLNTYLNSHPNVKAKGEHFGWMRGATFEKRAKDVFGKHPATTLAAGCKVFYYHPHDGDPQALFAWLREIPGLRVIHLRRRDAIRSVLSWYIAQNNKQFVATSKDALIEAGRKRLTVDPDEFIAWMRKTRQWESQATDLLGDRPMIDVFYEDLVADREATFGRVLDFLDLPAHQPRTYLRRQNPEPIQDLVANYDEIEARLKNSEFAELLAG